MTGNAAIVVLAGGRATRFPGKLEQNVGDEPLLQLVCRNARATGLPVYLAGSDEFTPAIAYRLDVPMLRDRWPGDGPLRALASACATIDSKHVFALAGDEPSVDAALLGALYAAMRPGDEAVVPRHGSRLEPLAALYDRAALLRESEALFARGVYAMHALLERLHRRPVDVRASYFTNVNTPGDLQRAARAVTR